MISAPELNTKITMSWYMLFGLIALTVLITTDVNRIFGQDDRIKTIKELVKNMEENLTGEIEGLRSDWERRNTDVTSFFTEIKEDIDNLEDELKAEIEESSTSANGRMDRKIKNHEKAEHK
jgi:hypothetical protein